MDPGNLIAYIILILIVIFAVWGTVKKIRHGSSCCGEHEASDRKVRVSDKDISHYPYRYELAVDGIHCANCARRIENAFNSVDGLWAVANIGEKKVDLRSKRQISDDELRSIVSASGYTLLSTKLM